ncbi:MAG: hypothetical protein DVB31_05420 [Verrucomicrobia bacterium]|nr:MAG: hypothetical protein DVB31_05420 [Verrucomicrobiota bacterium]
MPTLNKTAASLRALSLELSNWPSDPLARLVSILADEAEAAGTVSPQRAAAEEARAALASAQSSFERAAAAADVAQDSAAQAGKAAEDCSKAVEQVAVAVAALGEEGK